VPTYDLGDGVNLRYLAKDRDGQAVDASVSLAIISVATGLEVATPAVTRTALGQYDAATWVPVATGVYLWRWTVTGAIVDTEEGTFTVANPGPPVYVGLQSLKRALGKVTADDRDEDIQVAAVAASRMIDATTGRPPGAFQAGLTATTRTFSLAGRVLQNIGYMRSGVMVDDIASDEGVVIGIGTVATGVYIPPASFTLGPMNALSEGKPFEWVSLPYSFTNGTQDSIQVTARWGWPAIPSEVEMATRLLASRLYKRKDSPQGVIASADWGAVRVSRTDPDVYALISHLSNPGFA
jgi:hypothetical protein